MEIENIVANTVLLKAREGKCPDPLDERGFSLSLALSLFVPRGGSGDDPEVIRAKAVLRPAGLRLCAFPSGPPRFPYAVFFLLPENTEPMSVLEASCLLPSSPYKGWLQGWIDRPGPGELVQDPSYVIKTSNYSPQEGSFGWLSRIQAYDGTPGSVHYPG